MALYNEHGLNTARLANIYAAACGNVSLENIEPMDKDEKEIFEWAKSKLAQAKKEGKTIMFDIPFDPDDRYDSIYKKSADELAKETRTI